MRSKAKVVIVKAKHRTTVPIIDEWSTDISAVDINHGIDVRIYCGSLVFIDIVPDGVVGIDLLHQPEESHVHMLDCITGGSYHLLSVFI